MKKRVAYIRVLAAILLPKPKGLNNETLNSRLLILTIVLFGSPAYVWAQRSISKITLTYSVGHSSWDKPGIYSRTEHIQISPTTNGNFRLTDYFRVNHFAGSDGKTFTKDTLPIPIKKLSYIDRNKIEYWLGQLLTQKENFNASFVQSHLDKIRVKEISAVAQSMKQDLFFDKDFNEERRQIIRKIQSFYNLDSFLLLIRTSRENNMVVTDVWNRLRIEVIRGTDSTLYLSQFFTPLGQPLIVIEQNDFSTERAVYNLEANTSAQAFLPKNSLLFKMLDLGSIKEQYIRWCLDKYF